MGRAVMISVVNSMEAVLAVVAIDGQCQTLVVVVLAYLIPRFQALVAVVAEVMLQLVSVNFVVGADYIALFALKFDFVEDGSLDSARAFELINSNFAFFVWTYAFVLCNELVRLETTSTENLLASFARFSISDDILA